MVVSLQFHDKNKRENGKISSYNDHNANLLIGHVIMIKLISR